MTLYRDVVGSLFNTIIYIYIYIYIVKKTLQYIIGAMLAKYSHQQTQGCHEHIAVPFWSGGVTLYGLIRMVLAHREKDAACRFS